MDGELSSESDISVIRFKVEDRGFCFNGPGALQSKRVTEQNRTEQRNRTGGCRTEQRNRTGGCRTEQRNRGQRVAEQNRGIEDRGLQNRTEE